MSVHLAIAAKIVGLDDHHRASELARQELLDDFVDCSGVQIGAHGAAQDGAKGWLETLIVTCGSGSTAAAVQIFRSWLARDRKRSIEVKVESPNSEPTTVHVSGENVSLAVLEKAIEKALETGDSS